MTAQRTQVMDDKALARALVRIAHEIVEKNHGAQGLVIVGIKTRGAHLAERIAEIIAEIEKTKVPTGSLDITFYRDDIQQRLEHPVVQKTELLVPVEGQTVVVVDDVLFTGRTIRAAMDELIDFGRPKQIQLAVLIDRGHRELPIRADYVGKNLPTALEDDVIVQIKEIDRKDQVLVERKGKGKK